MTVLRFQVRRERIPSGHYKLRLVDTADHDTVYGTVLCKGFYHEGLYRKAARLNTADGFGELPRPVAAVKEQS